MTANVGQAYDVRLLAVLVAFLRRRLFDQLVVQALMGTFEVIMISELGAKNIHVRAAENYKVVQNFLLNGLDYSLNKGDCVGRWYGGLHGLDAGNYEKHPEAAVNTSGSVR